MSKFYTTTCQAKELAVEAKTANDKAKELNNEVLLKKGEVLRLTEVFNRLQGSETKLKNEVEELNVDNIEKDTQHRLSRGANCKVCLVLKESKWRSCCSL